MGLGGVTQEEAKDEANSVFNIGYLGSSEQERKIKKHATKRKRCLWLEWKGLVHAMHWPKHVTIMYLIFTTIQQFTVVSLFPFHRQWFSAQIKCLMFYRQ